MTLYANGIVAGALSELYDYPAKYPWSDPRKARSEKQKYNQFVSRARRANATGRRGRPGFCV